MKNKTNFHNCGRLEIRHSEIEGNGVFAIDPISKGEVLEECPFILFPRHIGLGKVIYQSLKDSDWLNPREEYLDNLRLNFGFKDPEKYYFKWYPPVSLDGEATNYVVLPLGYGAIYNTSNTANNAGWSIKDRTFVFKAEKDIAKDEEIKTFYGYFLGEDGKIFNCDTVFNLALDSFDGKLRLKAARFGSADSFNLALQNHSFKALSHLLSESKETLTITKICAVQSDMQEKSSVIIPEQTTVSQAYNKILEYNMCQYPMVRFYFEYLDKDGIKREDNIIFKK